MGSDRGASVSGREGGVGEGQGGATRPLEAVSSVGWLYHELRELWGEWQGGAGEVGGRAVAGHRVLFGALFPHDCLVF